MIGQWEIKQADCFHQRPLSRPMIAIGVAVVCLCNCLADCPRELDLAATIPTGAPTGSRAKFCCSQTTTLVAPVAGWPATKAANLDTNQMVWLAASRQPCPPFVYWLTTLVCCCFGLPNWMNPPDGMGTSGWWSYRWRAVGRWLAAGWALPLLWM